MGFDHGLLPEAYDNPAMPFQRAMNDDDSDLWMVSYEMACLVAEDISEVWEAVKLSGRGAFTV